MMANPEGTQQLRDRDLEFMFYDEAQVGVLLLLRAYGPGRFVCCLGLVPTAVAVVETTCGRCSRLQMTGHV